MIVYLLGYMGSGKSTVGKRLASSLKWEFIDLDKTIENQQRQSVAEIFDNMGESYFREAEASVLRELKPSGNTIVACGGGTPCFHENMDYMNITGFTIYLRMTPSALKSRLGASKSTRPLISGMDAEELAGFLDKSLSERERWYKMAEMEVDALNINIRKLSAHLEAQAL